MTPKRRIGCMGWLGIVLVLVAVAGFALWRCSDSLKTARTLDRIDGWFTDSLAATRVQYGAEPAQRLFVYPGDRKKPRPVLVFVHGGSWASGDPADYGFVARNFAPHGFVVVDIGYRLGPAGRFPAMVEDTAAALAWAHRNIGDYGGDSSRIVLMGHSAGAYNAAMVTLDRQWLGREGLPDGMIKCFVGLAGPYDFLPLDKPSTRAAFGHAPDLEATQPIHFVRTDAPPMLLITGDADETVKPRNSRALAAALDKAGVENRLLVLEGIDHAGVLTSLARPFDRDRRIKDAVLAFLGQCADATPASAPVKPGGG